ncbi:hypothetical protein ACTMTJ_15630 [Phytohabitans sp. LJ34]|uniref:hypothetical protein n=1 Tax=Phytohabitans sp. LJ34 TaxID=3452217 RepID=UPI003F8C6CAF
MDAPAVSYDDLDRLADAGRWQELLHFAAKVDGAPLGQRREVAHVVALEAPARVAVAAAELFPDEDTAFPGPLWEVVAHRPWRDLEPHFTNARTRYLVAHTRVLHGEDLRGVTDLESPRPGPPLKLEPWESARWDGEWDIPTYDRRGGSGCVIWAFPRERPDPVALPPSEVAPAHHDAVPVLDALSEAVEASAYRGTAWEAASVVAASGDACQAWQVPFADAYPHLVHLASGERPYEYWTGQAIGRIALWTALAAMAGTTTGADPKPVTALVERLRCVGWREADEPGWYLHLALEDPDQEIAWVVTGHDSD